ncbi:MAG: glycosyltransferase family 4 protein [Gaiellales bacterium]
MRIAIVTVAGYVHGIGGMQAHTADLARGLAERGHEVEVITARHPRGLEVAEYEGNRWHFVPVPTRYERLPMRHRAWLRASAKKFEQLHAARPFDVVHSESTSALGLLRRGVHRRVATAVKFHGNYLGLVAAALGRARRGDGAQRIAEAKHIVWVTGGHFIPPGGVYRFRACEAMVASRQQLRGTRWSFVLDPARMHVVPNGIDIRRFQPRPQAAARSKLGLDGGAIVLCVGRLAGPKGFDHAIAALRDLAAARLVIVGEGHDRGALETLAAGLGVSDRVLFAGAHPPDVVATYMAAADLFLFPTEYEEPAPVVLPEAMACGLPVIAADIGGIAEVIDRPGENGILVPPGAVDPLVGAAASLLADAAARRRMGEAARRRVEEAYTMELMVERTLAIYEIARRRLMGAQ